MLFSDIYCQFTYFHFSSLEPWRAVAVIHNPFAYNVYNNVLPEHWKVKVDFLSFCFVVLDMLIEVISISVLNNNMRTCMRIG